MKLTPPRSWSLAVKFPLTITAVVAGVGFTIGAVMVYQDWTGLRATLAEKALLLAGTVATSTPESVLRNDTWVLFKSLKSAAVLGSGGSSERSILAAMILDPDGRVLAHLAPAEHPIGLLLRPDDAVEKRLLEEAMRARTPIVLEDRGAGAGFVEGVVPIYAGDKRVGIVRLRLSTADLYARTWSAALIVLALTLALVVLGSAFGALVSARMVRPLLLLAEGMESIARSDRTEIAPVPVRAADELGLLAANFNQMAVELAEKRRLEEEAAINEKLVALGRVAAGVAHEVNNPLGGMLNCFDTLRQHPQEPELLKRYLPLLEKGLHRIRDIVRSLLVEVRMEQANERCGPECVEELRGLVEADIGEREVNLIWNNELPPDVRLNGPAVQQVVFNLLKNAVQATSDDGTVSFNAYLDDAGAMFEVRDDGPGIPEADRDRLFDPFFTTRTNGTGLGLWIVYRLVENMRGVIRVESALGSGACFNVCVPAEIEAEVRWAS